MTLGGLNPHISQPQALPTRTAPTTPLAAPGASRGTSPLSAPASDAWSGSANGRASTLDLQNYDAPLPFDTVDVPAESVPGDLAGSLRHVGPGALDQGASTFLQEVWSNALGGYQAGAGADQARSALEGASFDLASAS